MTTFAGYPIILTADRTLMADYRLLFDGMLAASLTTTTPPALLGNLLMPRARTLQGRASRAPLGLRRIEASLLAGGFTSDEVAVVPEHLLRFAIGPSTRIIGIDSGEPTGHGMNSTTMAGIAGGMIYPESMFRRLMRTIMRHKIKAPNAKIVLGGPGAWQIAQDPDQQKRLNIDHTIVGYAEGNVPLLFHNLLNGIALPAVIAGEGSPSNQIPAIRGASTMGVVEISRGCGWGCNFCTIARTPMQHLPEQTILADVRTNVESGQTSVAALSEDLFRYGATRSEVAPERLIQLLTQIRQIQGLRLIQVDHVNLASNSHYTDEQLNTVRTLLVGDTGVKFPWVNVGVETASGALLRTNGGKVKMAGRKDTDWGDFCIEQVHRLIAAGFLPMVSLIIGLPGETDADILSTLRWVESFAGDRVTIFPVLYAPVDGSPPITVGTLTQNHWKLIRKAYAFNFRWIPSMYWDNQAGAGTPAWKRILLQGMGRGQVLEWQAFFAWHSRRCQR